MRRRSREDSVAATAPAAKRAPRRVFRLLCVPRNRDLRPWLLATDDPSAINSFAIKAPTASLSFSSLRTDGDGTDDFGNVLDCQRHRGNRLGVRAPRLCRAPVIRHLGDGSPRQSQAL